MSDVSQGDGWWLASDGKWYPPELSTQNAGTTQHIPQQVVSPQVPQYVDVNQQQQAASATVPQMVSGPSSVGVAAADSYSDDRGRGRSSTLPLQVTNLVMVVVGFIGFFTTWILNFNDDGQTVSYTGSYFLNSDYGTLHGVFLGLLVLAALIGIGQLVRPNPVSSLVLFLMWGAVLVEAVYWITLLIDDDGATGFSNIGVGLWLFGVAGLVGALAAVASVTQLWSRDGKRQTWLPVLLVAALLIAGFITVVVAVGSNG